MGWIMNYWTEILLVAGILERLAKETKEDFVLFGLKIGKYDNQVSDFIGAILRALVPKKKE
ncbi:MAG: hypothetical protein A2Y66_01715 [Nitrospirae bacterium RBG_13_41_22]|nr:MAG: hypothetical protein A2Y66_01715 [Nitrospirae bacterium RBG_13_41_22]